MFATQTSGALIWDPSTGALSPGPVFDYNPFCSGHVQSSDGRVFFAGGQIGSLYNGGARDAVFYDPSTEVMSPVPDMTAGRW